MTMATTPIKDHQTSVYVSEDMYIGRTYLLNLSISCTSTVFIDSSYTTGNFLAATSKSKSSGNWNYIQMCKIEYQFGSENTDPD